MKFFRRGLFFGARRMPRRASPRPAMPELPAQPDDAPPKGCAWYDSSLDLRRGLLVQELAPVLLRVLA